MNSVSLRSSQQGSVIIVSLMLLLVMTTMGVGLVQMAGSSTDQVQATINRSGSLHSSETCIEELVRWLENESSAGKKPCDGMASGQVCRSVRGKDMGDWSAGDETANQKTKMQAQKYQCEVYLMTTVTASQSEDLGVGFSVGQSSAYGGAETQTKYLYRIRSNGTGPNDVGTVVEVIASMIF